ncbi:hypothetical protein AWW66_05160 [Micromonospora rosaria]|uniref:Uncharacterized protein n=1 Tax=Micromonospora rosaria TaxID=47874 RepID=A0A136PX94_9ACTN|nr:tetratricopeptide repeat protein [Micromonospora rosaria]KXK63035.1 hypothetical protein AWW66_05160 [Micromonospora rosaria]
MAASSGAAGVFYAPVTINARALVSWPHRVGAVPPQAHRRQERPADRLLDAPSTGDGGGACQVVTGLGGVGKTQLAAGLVHRLWHAGKVDLLVWVSATSRPAVVTAYAQAATDVTGAEDADPEQAVLRFLGWLATTTRRWLVVLDDVEDPTDLRGLWPPRTGAGRTVVTTRRVDSALTAGRQHITVDVFTPEESTDYLTGKLGGDPGRLAQAADLADDLGHLPLALAQAAAYILDRRSMTCAGYRRRLADRRRQLGALAPGVLPDDHPHAVAVTWSLSIERADTLPPAGLTRPVLELVALLDPNGIPAEVLTAPAVLDHLAVRTGEPVEADDVTDALDNLARLSLATLDESTGVVRAHRLLQRVVRESEEAVDFEQATARAVAVATALLTIWPEVERDREHAQTLRDNTIALHTTTGSLLWSTVGGGHPVLFEAGHSFGHTGQVLAAGRYFQTLYDTATAQLGAEHPDTLSARAYLAAWLGRAGDELGAVSALGELLADALRVLGPDDPTTLMIRGHLAFFRSYAGDPAGVASTYEELLADAVRVWGPDDPTTLTIRLNLAGSRGEAGDVAGALSAHEELLADALRVLDPDDPLLLAIRVNTTAWIGEAGDAAGAASTFEELCTEFLRVLGPDHPDTLAARHALATWRGEAGDAAGATAAFEELLGDLRRVLGPDHPNTLTARGHLANWHGRAGDAAGAAAAYEELVVDDLRVFGPDHQNTLSARNNLAAWRGEAGDVVGAMSAHEELLADVLRLLGPDQWLTLAVRERLAGWRGRVGDAAGAAAAYEELVVDRLRVFGPDHPDTLVARALHANWRGLAGDAAGAASAYDELLADALRVLGPDHPHTPIFTAKRARWRAAAARPGP